jgi:hypothetical protein
LFAANALTGSQTNSALKGHLMEKRNQTFLPASRSAQASGGQSTVPPPANSFSNTVIDALRDAELQRREWKKASVRLPCDDWLVSQFAAEVAAHVYDAGIYLRCDEVVTLDNGVLRVMTPRQFRTWVEDHLVTYKVRQLGKAMTVEVFATMTEDTAAATLAAPQFRHRLLSIQRLNRCQLPILRDDGKLELLTTGYDLASKTLTVPNVDCALDMPVAEAVQVVEDLLGEYQFTDTRSKSVAVAGLVGLYAAQMVPEKSLRPCFILIANAEGAGKTLLVLTMTVPVLGQAPTGCKADTDDEMRKVLSTGIREGRLVNFFDNVKGHLSCEPLEAFLSAPVWSDRKLGSNESFTGDNLATVFVTGNGLTVSPDMRRRSLFIELHLSAERAEDRQFRRPLDLPTLMSMRPRILAALWSLVKHWDKQGRPAPSRSHSAFPSWAQIVGGIVEAAGWECPLNTAQIAAAADPDGDDMRALVKAMAEAGNSFTFGEVVEKARTLELFDNLIGGDGELDHRDKARFARLLGRYDRRQVSDWRFCINGKGRNRTYGVESCHGDMVCHGVSNSYRKNQSLTLHLETPCQTMTPLHSDLLPDDSEMADYLKGVKA